MDTKDTLGRATWASEISYLSDITFTERGAVATWNALINSPSFFESNSTQSIHEERQINMIIIQMPFPKSIFHTNLKYIPTPWSECIYDAQIPTWIQTQIPGSRIWHKQRLLSDLVTMNSRFDVASEFGMTRNQRHRLANSKMNQTRSIPYLLKTVWQGLQTYKTQDRFCPEPNCRKQPVVKTGRWIFWSP